MIAQNELSNSSAEIVELYKIVENYYPINDEYINGFIYPVPNTKITGDPYLNTSEWIDGTLYINEKSYSPIFLKYDLIIDELVIKSKTGQNIERLLVINKSQLDSFNIGSLVFINSRNLFPNEVKNTFYEKVYDGKLSVYKHYEKRYIDTYTSSSPYGTYSRQKSNLYFFDSEKLININNDKSFLDYFEKDTREKIKKYIKAHKINYKKASDSQLCELMEFTATLIFN